MKKLIGILLAISLVISVPAAVLSADNVTADAQAFVKGLKIMTGDPDGNFRGYDNLTRAEFVKVVIATTDNKFVPKNSISPYSDVPYTHWSAGYIDYATKQNLFTGLPDGSFEPERNVKYEELCKVFLIMIGYGSEGYGYNWESAQIDQANALGLLKNSNCHLGGYATRDDVAIILTNMLLTRPKGMADKYVNTLGYKYMEDVLIITDKNVPNGYVATSNGNYKKGILEDASMKSGDMVVNSDDEIIMFSQSDYTEDYVIKASLPDEIIAFSPNGDRTIEFDDDTAVYTNSVRSSFGLAKQTLQTGDMLTVYLNESGQAKYIKVTNDAITGPVTNQSGNFIAALSITEPNPKVLIDGKSSTADEVKNFDICYYVPQVNTVLVYTKRLTGVYEDALPNKDNLTSIKLSGKEYKVGSKTAFTKLSSDDAEFGDIITIVFDKNGYIGDIVSANTNEVNAGYIMATGTKETVNPSGETGSAYFAKILLTDGNTVEYLTDKNYKDTAGNVRLIKLQDGKATINSLGSTNRISGTFDWSAKKLGTYDLSGDVKIIDTYKYDNTRINYNAITVFPQRLDGVKLDEKDIIYTAKDKDGKITEIALEDVTGDLYNYGIVLKSVTGTGGIMTVGQYDVNIAGRLTTIAGNAIFNVGTGIPAQFDLDANGTIAKNMRKITTVSGKITAVDSQFVYVGATKYKLAEKVQIFKKIKSNDMQFNIIPVSELTGDEKLTAYYDKPESSGGRIRAVIAE